MNRDSKVDGGQGQVNNRYEFLNVAQRFTDDTPLPEDKEKPTIPENFKAELVTSRRAALSWSPATDNDSIGKYNLRLIGNEEIVERSTMRLAIVLYTKASSMKLSTGLKTIIQVNLENGDLGDRFLDS